MIAVIIIGHQALYWGYKRMLLLCLAGSALLFLPQALTGNVINLIGVRFLQGLFLGGLLPMANALISTNVTPVERGSAFGFTSSAFFFGIFVGPLAAGLWTAFFSLTSVFYAAGLLLFLCFVGALWGIKETSVRVNLKADHPG